MKIVLLALILFSNLFALSPFSLEGFKEANVKVLYKGKLISKEYTKKLKENIKKELQKVGIKTKSENYSNFVVWINIIKLEKIYVVNVDMMIVEDVIALRDKTENMGITYKKSDFFDTDDLEVELQESVIEFLLSDFTEQYVDENS